MNDRFLTLLVNNDVAPRSEAGQSEVAMPKVLRWSNQQGLACKGQEIAHIYNDADAVVGSIIKKIGVKPN